jgi:membrane associated rhomboid family serine protease
MLFPIHDDNPTVRRPYVTIALIAVNALVFLYTKSLGVRGFQEFIFTYGFTPDVFFNLEHSYILPRWIYMTPIYSMFLHGGWMHLIGNMLFLWIFGNNVEDYFGPVKFILFYAFSGLAAIALYSAFSLGSQVPLVGASGAIAGVMGAYIVLYPRAEITCLFFFILIQFITLPAKIVLGIWFAIQFIMVFTGNASGSGVAWMAHVGGFAFGVAVLWLLVRLQGRRRSGGQRIYKMQW